MHGQPLKRSHVHFRVHGMQADLGVAASVAQRQAQRKQRLGGSGQNSRIEPLWYSQLLRETLVFQSNREEESDGETNGKKKGCIWKMSRWIKPRGQVGRWRRKDGGGLNFVLTASLPLPGGREGSWLTQREGESVLTDLFLILSLSDHNLSPTFFIAFPLTSLV